MATEADIPEPVPLMERGVTGQSNQGEFDYHPETADHLVKSEAIIDKQAETTHNSFEENAVAKRDVSFSESSLIAKILDEETKATSETSRTEVEMPENEKQIKQDENFKNAEEAVSKESGVSRETEEIAEKERRCDEISDSDHTEVKKQVLVDDVGSAIVMNLEEVEIPAVTLAKDKSSTQEVGFEAVDKPEENFSIASNIVASHGTNDSNECGVVNETEEKTNVEISSASKAEELCLQESDKTEIYKVVSETCPEDVKMSQGEEHQTEIAERTPEIDSVSAEKVAEERNSEEKLDSLVTEPEEQAVVEALAENNTDFPPPELHDKIDISEVAIPNNNEDELNVQHPVKQETVLVKGEELGKVSDSEPQDQNHETSEEELNQTDSQACETTKISSFDLPLETQVVTTEPSSETSEISIPISTETPPKDEVEGNEKAKSIAIEEFVEDSKKERTGDSIAQETSENDEIPSETAPTPPADRIASSEPSETNARAQVDTGATENSKETFDIQEEEMPTDTGKGEEIVSENNITSLSEDPVNNIHNDDDNAEKSSTEIFKKPEIDATVDGILTEAKESDESPDFVKDHENQQTKNLILHQASREDGSGLAEDQERSVMSAKAEAGSSSQQYERETEAEKDELFINENNIENYSQESVEPDPDKNVQNDYSTADKPNIFEKSDTANTIDDTKLAEVEEHHEVILKGEEGIEQILKKNESKEHVEPEEKIEQALEVISAELEAGDSTELSDSAVEEEVEKKTEEGTRNESNVESLSQEPVVEDPVKNFNSDENSAQQSNTAILEDSEAARTVDNISHETNPSKESSGVTMSSSLAKEVENLQDEGKNIPEESSVEDAHDTEPEILEVQGEKETLKSEEALPKVEHGENLEQAITGLSAEFEYNLAPELQKKAPEELVTSSDVIAAETREIMLSEEALLKENEAPCEEHLDSTVQKVEPGELIESLPEVIIAETKESMLSNKETDDVILDDVEATTNTEETVGSEKKEEGYEDIDENKVEKFPTSEVDKDTTPACLSEDTEHEPKEKNEQALEVISAEMEAGASSQLSESAVTEESEKKTEKTNVESLSQESVAEDPVKNINNDDNSTEQSNTEILEDSEAARTCNSIETNQSKEVERQDDEGKDILQESSVEETSKTADPFIDETTKKHDSLTLQASPIGEQESMASENRSPPEASITEKIDESPFSPKPEVENENNTEAEILKVQDEQEKLKSGEDLEQALEKVEQGKNLEQSITGQSAEFKAGTFTEMANNPEKEFDSKEAELSNVEHETKEHAIDEPNIKSLPKQSVEEGTNEIFEHEESNAEVPHEEILESVMAKTEESISHEANWNNESTSHPVVEIEEKNLQDKHIDSAETLRNEKKEDDGSIFQAMEDDAEVVELVTSSDVITAETREIIFSENTDDRNSEEALSKENETSCQENLETTVQKNESEELNDSIPEGINAPTEASIMILDEVIATQNSEEIVDLEKKEEGYEESKVEKFPTTEVDKDTRPACPSEDTEKHIITGEGVTTDISPQATREETAPIHEDKAEGKSEVEMHENLELTSIVEENEKQAVEEVNVENDQPTGHAMITEDDVKKMQESTEDEDIEEQVIEKCHIIEDNSEVPVSPVQAENLVKKEDADQNETVRPKEEIRSRSSEVTEDIAAVGSEVPKDSDTVKDKQQPGIVLYPLKASEEEIRQMESDNHLVEKSVTGVTGEMSFKEVALEDKRQLDSSGTDTQEKEQTIVDTEEAILNNFDTDARQDDAVVESKECEIPAKEDEDEEDIKHGIQNKAVIAGNDDENERIISETPSEEISDDSPVQHSEISPNVSELVTNKDSKLIEADSANEEISLISSQASEPIHTEHESTTAEKASELGFIDAKIENTNEEAKTNQDVELCTEHSISQPEHAKTSEMEETKTSEDEEVSNVEDEALKRDKFINANTKQVVLEEANLVEEFESLEKEATRENDTTEIKSYKSPTEENNESAESSEKLEHTSEIMTRDVSDEIILERDQIKVEEYGISESVEQNPQESQESREDTEEKIESKLEVECQIKETQFEEVITKDAIITQELQTETKKGDAGLSSIEPMKDSEEVIKEQIIEDRDGGYDNEKKTPVAQVPLDSNLEEVRTDDKSDEACNFSSDYSHPHAVEAKESKQDSMTREEKSPNLAFQTPTDDHENEKQENVAVKTADVNDILQSGTSDVVDESKFQKVEELPESEINDKIGEPSEMSHKSPDDETIAISAAAIDQSLTEKIGNEQEKASPEMICEEQDIETKAATKNLEENMLKVSTENADSSVKSLEVDIAEDRFEEDAERGRVQDEVKDEIKEASETGLEAQRHEAARKDEVADDQILQEEQYQAEPCALSLQERELVSSTKVEKTEVLLENEPKEIEEVFLQKEESRKLQVSELQLDNPHEAQDAIRTSVENEDKRDASESILESMSEGKGEIKEKEIFSVQTYSAETPQEQTRTLSSAPLSSQKEDETSESTAEKTKEMEPRELQLDTNESKDGIKEEIKEESELVSKSSSEENTTVAEYGFTSDHPLPTEKSEEQNQTSSAGLLSEKQEQGISTIEVTEDEGNPKEEATTVNLMAEENQSQGATEATQFTHTEVTKEQIKEEKVDAENCHAIIIDEVETKESHEENKLEDEESRGDKIVAKQRENELLSEKADASETTDEQISIGAAEHLHRDVAQNETVKTPLPDEIRGEDVEDKSRSLNMCADGITEFTSAREKELGVERVQTDSTTSLEEATNTIPSIHQEEKIPDGSSENQISGEAEAEKMIPHVVQEQLKETLQVTEAEGLQPANPTNVDSGINKHKEHGAESEENAKAAKISLFDMMQQSTRKPQEYAESKEPTTAATKGEPEKVKSDEEVVEEGEDEHEKNDSGSDAPVIVEASKDIDIKVAHKKSHNILSEVGSKVKHSIIKVKKAITGKSSHPKQHPPK